MSDPKPGDIVEPVVPPTTPKEPVTPPVTTPAPSQPSKKPRLEKLKHTRASLDRQIEEEEAKLGNPAPDPDLDDDDAPVTKGDLKRMEAEKSQQAALALVNGITDEAVRAQVKDVLATRIVPSGDPQKDFQAAQDLVFSEKNRQIAGETGRKGRGARTPSGGGTPPPPPEDFFQPSAEELRAVKIAKVPADKQKEWILKVRKDIAQSGQ